MKKPKLKEMIIGGVLWRRKWSAEKKALARAQGMANLAEFHASGKEIYLDGKQLKVKERQ